MSLIEWKEGLNKLLKARRLAENSRTDFVLVYKIEEDNQANLDRQEFFNWIRDVGINIKETQYKDQMLVEINIPLFLLCFEANKNGVKAVTKYSSGLMTLMRTYTCNFLSWSYFQGEDIRGCDNISVLPDQKNIKVMDFMDQSLFMTSTRSLLAYYILNSPGLLFNDPFEDFSELGLNTMLSRKIFIEGFPIHDYDLSDAEKSTERIKFMDEASDKTFVREVDMRSKLYVTWKRFLKYQPIHMIRNYFGTHIALYFAWCDVLLITLWIPMIFGFITFLYGMSLDIGGSNRNVWINGTSSKENHSASSLFKNAFDNELMPPYAIIVTLWGTLFLELWKRENSKLAYLWDVKSLEDIEPDRPQFIETGELKSLVGIHLFRLSVSFAVTLLMVFVIILITGILVLYRVIMLADICSGDSMHCFMLSDVVATVLNSIGIIFLGKIYRTMAYRLTEWENYRTQTEFTDALIIKLFAFEFANSYTACFYVAFFRRSYENGLFGFGSKYNDVCESTESGSCMPLLSFQIFFLMILTPIPKLFGDFLIPIFKRTFMGKNKIIQETPGIPHVIREYNKEPLENFTISEYSEKVVLYGYLMLFAASFPLAPLIAMLTLIADIRIDCHRLLYINRRPVAFISQDIGMWYDILNFINMVGVLVNACLIAFTSQWGERLTMTNKLIFVLFFENLIFAMKYFIAIVIPDIPKSVRNAKKMDVIKSGRIFSVRYSKRAKSTTAF